MNDIEKSVTLIYQNISHRGPGKVVQNLREGLKKIGFSIQRVTDKQVTKYTGCLQYCSPEILLNYAKNKKPILMGPNLFTLPPDNPGLCKAFNHFIVPSAWVREKYKEFDLMKDKNIYVWSVGIDTDEWSAGHSKSKTLDCFIYFKNRTEQDLAIVEAICRKFNKSYKVIKYGNYQENELKYLCEQSKFCILLTGTESQGIAYMQILSSNIPCYVFNNPTWKSDDGKETARASSVPYWDSRCGFISNNVNLKHFTEFLEKCEKGVFMPREYILENHTLEKSAERYYSLLMETVKEEKCGENNV